MKKSVFIITLLAMITQWSFAQKGDEVTVYLTNGSVIKGWLTQQSNSRLKVETGNGSVIHFTEKSVKEIIFEEDRRRTNKRSSGSNNAYTSTTKDNKSSGYKSPGSRTYKSKTYSSQGHWFPGRTPGYRGFADLGYTFGVGDYSVGRFEMTTSHGYQFNPYIFLGGGIGMNFYKKETVLALGGFIGAEASIKMFPIYADFRANFTEEGPFIPFAGVRLGYSFGNIKYTTRIAGISASESSSESGFYLAPAIGVKYMVMRSLGVNLSLGYTAQFIDGENFGGITLRAGVEF